MVIVNYKSKRKLKMAIGGPLDYVADLNSTAVIVRDDDPFFVTNFNKSFRATVTLIAGKITEVR